MENDALRLEQLLLDVLKTLFGALTHTSLRIDHPVPRKVIALRGGVEGVSDLAGVSVETSQRRHLAIGHHPAARHAVDNGVDALIRIRFP